VIYLQRLLCFFALFFHTRFAQKKTRQILGITTRLFRRRRKRKREREKASSRMDPTCVLKPAFFAFFSLDYCPSLSLSLFSNFFFPQTLTVYFFPKKSDLSSRLQSITISSPITPPRVKRIERKSPNERRCTSRARNRAVSSAFCFFQSKMFYGKQRVKLFRRGKAASFPWGAIF